MSVMPIDGSPVHVRIQNYTNKNIKLAVVLHKSEHPKHNQRAVLSWADVPQHGISKKHNTYFGQERHEQSWFSSADLWCVYWLAEDLTIHASRPSGFSDLIENFDGTLLMTTNASSFKEITPHKLLFGLQVPAYHETVDPRALFNYLAPLPNGVRGYDVLQTNDEFPKPVVFPELTASVQACLDNSVHLGSRFKISATSLENMFKLIILTVAASHLNEADEDTLSFKEHRLESDDRNRTLDIILNDDKVTFTAPSGTSTTSAGMVL